MSVDINPEVIANTIKEEGNNYFKRIISSFYSTVEGDYSKACDKYTEAINIYPTAILYGRKPSVAMIGQQIARSAICDWNVVETLFVMRIRRLNWIRRTPRGDSSSCLLILSFYRRGSAHFYSGNLQEALNDFKQCLAVNPVNSWICVVSFTCSGVRKKIEEIRKLIKMERFSSAIHVENVSFADQVVLKDLRIFLPSLRYRLLHRDRGSHH